MTQNRTKDLIGHLINLCQDLTRGQYGSAEELFELTKRGSYPPEITNLAETFGMMLIKVETREFKLKKTIDELQVTQNKLKQVQEKLARENVGLKRSLGLQYSPKKIIGQNIQMRELLDQVEKIADTPISVLVTGETGTGKELIARSLHYNSARSQDPFIALNCSAIPETLIESELFGIEKGVASGVDKRSGKIEQANGGTLFLDEIGDMPLASQAKILRVLEERQVTPIGGKKSIAVDIRLVSATNKDLEKEITQDRFRQDLYYRIKVVHLHIPPLRERPDDIPLLFKSLMDNHTKKMNKDTFQFTKDVISYLTRYPWPGNVRELENEVERIVALAASNKIEVDDLSGHIRAANVNYTEDPSTSSGRLYEAEKHLIETVLHESGNNKTLTAKKLGISREGLRKKMKRYGIS